MNKSAFFDDLFFYGTQFYRPPNPPMDQRRRDLENVGKLGLNVIKIFAEWNWINHHEGVFDFSELIDIAEQASKLNIKIVVNTRLEQVPYWLARKYPDGHYISAKKRKIEIQTRANTPTGGWPGLCFDHPGVRKAAEDFFIEIAKSLGGFDNILIFDCWNEPHIEPMEWSDQSSIGDLLFCYCPHTIGRYREWLKAKYKTIEAVNEKWFRRFQDFEDILPPPRLMDYVDMMEWRKFMTWSMADHMKWRYRTLKSHLPEDKYVMSHTVFHGISMGFGLGGADDYQLSEDLDLFGVSLFPLWGNHDAYDVACNIGISHGMSRGKTCINLELQGGSSASSPTGFTRSAYPKRNHYRTWNFADVAFGMKGIMYWHYRSEMLGREAPGFGLVKRDGSFTERSDETSKLCRFFNKYPRLFNKFTAPPKQAGILITRDSYYLNFASEGEEVYSQLSSKAIHRFFLKNGIEADFLVEEMLEEKIGEYRVIYCVLPLVVDEKTAGLLKQFVEKGGVLISECCVGSFDSFGVASEIIPGTGLHDLFGVKRDEIRQYDWENRESVHSAYFKILDQTRVENIPDIYFQGTNSLEGESVKMTTFLENFHTDGGEPILIHDQKVVGSKNSYGKGTAYLFGTAPGQSLYFGDDGTEKALLKLFDIEKIEHRFADNLILKEIGFEDTRALFIINPADEKKEGEYAFEQKVKIIESYDAGFSSKLKEGEKVLSFEIAPQDANCIIFRYRS
jgi:beta-galactosidase